MKTKIHLLTATAGAVVLALAAGTAAFGSEAIKVVSWGGAYTKSQVEAFHKPFTAKTGVVVQSLDYNGGLAEIKAQQDTKNVSWDVVDVLPSDAIRGCAEGYFEKIDPAMLPAAPDGTPAVKDFVEGTLMECAVGNILWSTVFAYNAQQFKGAVPKTIADVFDVKKFPQKRALQKRPQNNLEWALIADGVPANDVYKVLRTKEGVDRAFKKLDTIKPFVSVWWTAGAQPPELLASGEVAITTAYNGRIFDAVQSENKPFVIIWDHQVWQYDLFAIPKGSRNVKRALEFVQFATSSKALADSASWISYGPARKSAMPLVGKHWKTSVDMKTQLPTAPAHFNNAIQQNIQFWADHQDELNQRFSAWLAK